MTDHADLTAALRYDCGKCRPCTRFKREAADALDAADAENARLTADRQRLADIAVDVMRERDEALAEVAQLRAERSAALVLLDIHAKDPFHPDVRAALRGVLAVSEEATDG